MTTSARAMLLVLLLGAPSAARAQVQKPRPVPASKATPKPAEKTAPRAADKTPPKAAEPMDDPLPKPADKPADKPASAPTAEQASQDTSWRSRMHYGPALQLSMALSRNNAGKSLTPLPLLALGFAFDIPVDGGFYVRLEPSLGVLWRSSKIQVVREIDARQYDPNDPARSDPSNIVITTQELTNKVTHLSFTARALAGYDYTPTLTGRAGFLLGYGTAGTGASACSDDNRVGAGVYGLHLTPVAYRHEVDRTASVEVSLVGELRWQTVPRCDVPLKGGYDVPAGAVATFNPQVVRASLPVGVIGLQGAVLF